jgi:hypothetical protein
MIWISENLSEVLDPALRQVRQLRAHLWHPDFTVECIRARAKRGTILKTCMDLFQSVETSDCACKDTLG